MKSIRTKITMCLIFTVLAALFAVGGTSIVLNYRSTIHTVEQMMGESAAASQELSAEAAGLKRLVNQFTLASSSSYS